MFSKIDVNKETFSDCRTLAAALKRQHPPSGRLELRSGSYDDKGWREGSRKMVKAFQKSTHITVLKFRGFRFTAALEATFTNVLMGLKNLEELNLIECRFDQPPPNLFRGILQLKRLRRFKIEQIPRGLLAIDMDMDILRSISKTQVQSVCVPLYCLEKIHWNYIFRNIGLVELQLSSYVRGTKKLSLCILKALMSSKTIKKFSGNVSFSGIDIAKVFGQIGNPVEWRFGYITINLENAGEAGIMALRQGFSKATVLCLDIDPTLNKHLVAVVERSTFSASCWSPLGNPADQCYLAILSNPRLMF